MAVYRNVSINFWSDPKVDDEFTPEDKYFYLYLITNPHTNICGCYEIGRKQIERETGYTWDTIDRLLTRMEKVHDVIRFSRETKEVLLVNWGKYNWKGSSDKTGKAVKNTAQHIKHPGFRSFILRAYDTGDFTYTENSNSNSIQSQYAVTDTDTDTVSAVATDGTMGYTYPMQGVSDNTCPQVIHKDIHKVIHSRLGDEVLTMDDYEKLCADHDRVNVDATILRIIERPYHGCLNPDTVAKWADEMPPSHLPVTPAYEYYFKEKLRNASS